MAIPSFYHPRLEVHDKSVSLDSNEASHAVKARRLGVGQKVRLFNGMGLVGLGLLSSVGRREVCVELNSVEKANEVEPRISIAVALPKGDRQKVMVEMLTQLGVFEIIPLRCRRSVTKFSGNTSEKWARAAIEACKQSQNPHLPFIREEHSFEQLLRDEDREFVFADAAGVHPKPGALPATHLTVLVGPEGGFSNDEFAMLRQRSIMSIKLGPYILRSEAAAFAMASLLCGRR